MFKSGDKVAEHLELVRLLGAGGMGAVWVARHLRLRTEVAVKFLSASMLDNSAARSRFDREAQWVAQVKSPHVVQVLDQGVTDANPPQPFIVMELLEGEDLGRLVERVRVLPLSETLHILEQACAGLAAAHAAGLVHRDIKPENIFLLAGDRPFVKILDFGVARAADDTELNRLTHTGGVIGTAHYMSPEQLFEGKQVDQRTDIWALGVVAYRMLTGHMPFDGNTYGDLCLAVNQGVYTPASQRVPLPPEIDSFIARALAIDRNQRFSSARQFADELRTLSHRQSALSGLPTGNQALAQSAVPRTAANPGTGSGATSAVSTATGPAARTRGSGATAALHTTSDTGTAEGAALTVESLPMQRTGMLAVGVLLGVALLGAAVVGAFRLWSNDGASAPHTAGTGRAASQSAGSNPAAAEPRQGPETQAKASAPPLHASSAASVVEASGPSADAFGSKSPRAQEQTPPDKASATKARAASKNSSGTTPKPVAPKPKSPPATDHDETSRPKSNATSPVVAKEKYRGF